MLGETVDRDRDSFRILAMDQSEMLPVYEGHMMPAFGDEPPCSYGCKYCFAHTKGFCQDADQLKPGSPAEADRQIRVTLERLGKWVHCLVSSRFHELFARDEQEGLAHVRRLAGYGKSVSLLTKAALSARTVDELNNRMKEQGNRLAVEVSFVSGRDRPDLEVHAPTVQARIDAARLLAAKDVPVGACISPVLPEEIVSTDELCALVEETRDVVGAYTVSRGFAYTDEIDERMGLSMLPGVSDHTTHNHTNPLVEAPTFSHWHLYSDPRTHELKKHIRRGGRPAFSRSTLAVNHLIRTAGGTVPEYLWQVWQREAA